MNIGLTRKSYPEKRCIITSNEHDYIFQKHSDITRYLRKVPILNRKIKEFTFIPVYNPKVDLYHSFNDICITNKRWLVTFETMLPRFNIIDGYHRQEISAYPAYEVVNSYLKRIAASNCLSAIAISQSTFRIQKELLNSYPEVKRSILNKTQIIYPPQNKLITEESLYEKTYDKLKLIFVGNDFYRKGGSELVLAIDELINEQKIVEDDVEVVLVGNLNKPYNYVLGNYQDKEVYVNSIQDIINKRRNIKILPKVKNELLLEIIKDSHIGFLPTWADTFGYSVLEFQASGCPVISTNVRALPEINNSQVGWMINVDTNTLGEIVIDSYEKKQTIRRVIIDGLKSAILECLDNKELIRQKAIKALDRIEKVHSIEKYNKKLTQIYNQQ